MSIDFDFLVDTLRQLLAAVPTTLGLFFASLGLGGLLSLAIVAMRVSPRWPRSCNEPGKHLASHRQHGHGRPGTGELSAHPPRRL